MFIIIVTALLVGIWRYRSAAYFRWVGITFLWMLAGRFLFSTGGSYPDPSGEGLITRQVRLAAQSGQAMDAFATGVTIALWCGIIYFLYRAAKAARAHDAAREDGGRSAEPSGAGVARKALETVGLAVVTCAWLYFSYSAARSAQIASGLGPQGAGQQTVEQRVRSAAAEVNAKTPRRIDQITVLERASASARTLTYHYKIEAPAAQRDGVQAYVLTQIVPKACTGSLRAWMEKSGVSYAYSYTGIGFTDPVTVTVDKQLCRRVAP